MTSYKTFHTKIYCENRNKGRKDCDPTIIPTREINIFLFFGGVGGHPPLPLNSPLTSCTINTEVV